jgi:hypothetical protein
VPGCCGVGDRDFADAAKVVELKRGVAGQRRIEPPCCDGHGGSSEAHIISVAISSCPSWRRQRARTQCDHPLIVFARALLCLSSWLSMQRLLLPCSAAFRASSFSPWKFLQHDFGRDTLPTVILEPTHSNCIDTARWQQARIWERGGLRKPRTLRDAHHGFWMPWTTQTGWGRAHGYWKSAGAARLCFATPCHPLPCPPISPPIICRNRLAKRRHLPQRKMPSSSLSPPRVRAN